MGRSSGRLFLGDEMKVIGICGSPRKGNTEFLLREALKAAEEKGAETELILLREKRIEFCDGCSKCEKTGICHIIDDMQEVYEKLEEADAIILGSPNYYDNVSGLMKNFIDRTLVYYSLRENKIKGKKGGIIAVGGGSADEAFEKMEVFFSAYGIKLIGGVKAIAGSASEIPKNKKAVKEVRKLGMKLVE
ncbi:MAG: NAD(P)H-dependent oxidoreductase [Candidatus Aenigmatarchaeota archaeon]